MSQRLVYSIEKGHFSVGWYRSDLQKRGNVHREAFNPSKVTNKSYRNVINAPKYRSKPDWITVAPDGSFASYWLIRYDKNSKIDLIESVGA